MSYPYLRLPKKKNMSQAWKDYQQKNKDRYPGWQGNAGAARVPALVAAGARPVGAQRLRRGAAAGDDLAGDEVGAARDGEEDHLAVGDGGADDDDDAARWRVAGGSDGACRRRRTCGGGAEDEGLSAGNGLYSGFSLPVSRRSKSSSRRPGVPGRLPGPA